MASGDLYDVPPELEPFVRKVSIHKGAVWFVHTTASMWLEKGEAILAAAPAITDVELEEVTMEGRPPRWNPRLPEILASALMTRILGLHLAHNWLTDEDAALVAGSPQVRGLVRLDLSFNRLGEKGLEALWVSPNLRSLKKLGLDGNLVPLERREFADWNGQVLSEEEPEVLSRLRKQYGQAAWLSDPDASWLPA